MSLELITQIIILLTALVGLYKAATFHHHKTEESNTDLNSKNTKSSFSDFFELIGVFLFMLAFPAFMYAFMWIISNLPNSVSKSSSLNDLPAIEINKNSTDTEIMLASALNISQSYTRDDQLVKIIKLAIQNKDYVTALKAASVISSSNKKDDELKKIINEISNKKETSSNKQSSENEKKE